MCVTACMTLCVCVCVCVCVCACLSVFGSRDDWFKQLSVVLRCVEATTHTVPVGDIPLQDRGGGRGGGGG